MTANSPKAKPWRMRRRLLYTDHLAYSTVFDFIDCKGPLIFNKFSVHSLAVIPKNSNVAKIYLRYLQSQLENTRKHSLTEKHRTKPIGYARHTSKPPSNRKTKKKGIKSDPTTKMPLGRLTIPNRKKKKGHLPHKNLKLKKAQTPNKPSLPKSQQRYEPTKNSSLSKSNIPIPHHFSNPPFPIYKTNTTQIPKTENPLKPQNHKNTPTTAPKTAPIHLSRSEKLFSRIKF